MQTLTLIVREVRQESPLIRSFRLESADGSALPAYSPGSHIKVQIPGLHDPRNYSLINAGSDSFGAPKQYRLGVRLEENSQGGSRYMHALKEGDVITAQGPANEFPLADHPASTVLIAGGIGITPMLSMIRSFGELPPCSWKLYYLSQSAATTAYLKMLADPAIKANVRVHHDEGDPAKSFDLWPVLEKPNRGHVYCCGPRGLMEAVRDMSGHWSPSRVHFESFVDGGVPRADDRPFDVELARTGKTLTVPAGKTILGVLREADVRVPYSCESGTCGSCRTTLLEGQADHRDMVLMEEEHASQIMVCVSRGCGKLVLDL